MGTIAGSAKMIQIPDGVLRCCWNIMRHHHLLWIYPCESSSLTLDLSLWVRSCQRAPTHIPDQLTACSLYRRQTSWCSWRICDLCWRWPWWPMDWRWRCACCRWKTICPRRLHGVRHLTSICLETSLRCHISQRLPFLQTGPSDPISQISRITSKWRKSVTFSKIAYLLKISTYDGWGMWTH